MNKINSFLFIQYQEKTDKGKSTSAVKQQGNFLCPVGMAKGGAK